MLGSKAMRMRRSLGRRYEWDWTAVWKALGRMARACEPRGRCPRTTADLDILMRAAFVGRTCTVKGRDRECLFAFGEDASLWTYVPWRILTSRGVALAYDERGPALDTAPGAGALARANSLLQRRPVVAVDVNDPTTEIRVELEGDVVLEVLSGSSERNSWHAAFMCEGRVMLAIGRHGRIYCC